MCIEYWASSEGRDTSEFHPPKETCDVPVENRMLSVLGHFHVNKEYGIFLHVYENGFQGTTSGQQLKHISTESEGRFYNMNN